MATLDRVFIIESILSSRQSWEKTFNSFYDGLLKGIEHEEIRNTIVEFKFYTHNRKKYQLRYINFITNLIMWQPFIVAKPTLDESYIFDCSNITADSIKDYIDEKVIKPHRRHITNKTRNLLCSQIISKLKMINEDFSIVLGISLNVKSDIDLLLDNPEFRTIVYDNIPTDIKTEDAEAFAKEKIKRVIQIIKNTPNHCLYPTLNAGDGINHKQYAEYEVGIGPKPNGQGGIYPRVVGSSFLNGMNSTADYFIESTAGRNAQIINKIHTGKTGFFARKLELLCMDTLLHPDPNHVCNTKVLTPITIRSERFLEHMMGVYYKFDPHDDLTFLIDDMDLRLIGKTIFIYSPATCAGEKVCHRCYGELSFTNNDISIGGIAAKAHSSKITQRMLSAKHQLASRTKPIQWVGEFDRFFMFDGNWVMATEELDSSKYVLSINMEDIIDNEEDDDDNDDESYSDGLMAISKLTIINKKMPSEHYVISTDDETPIYLGDQINEYFNDNNSLKKATDTVEIELDELDYTSPIFIISIENNELSATFNAIKNLLDSKTTLQKYSTIADALQAFCDALLEGDLNVNFVHSFTIFRNLIRDSQDVLTRPHFDREDIDPVLMDMTSSLLNHPSPLITLSFQDLKRRFATVSMFKRHKPSIIDALYFRTIGEMENVMGFEFPDAYTRKDK